MRIKIIITSIISLYAISVLPLLDLPYRQQSDLRTAIQLVQKLSDSSNSDQIEFESVFYDSLKALRLTAGIKVLVVKAPRFDTDYDFSILIIDAKPPHLLPADLNRYCFSHQSQNVHPYMVQLKSFTTIPPTPPPIFS